MHFLKHAVKKTSHYYPFASQSEGVWSFSLLTLNVWTDHYPQIKWNDIRKIKPDLKKNKTDPGEDGMKDSIQMSYEQNFSKRLFIL